MKARVKSTGVIVNVQFLSKSETFTKYIDSSNNRYLDVELDFSDLNAGPEDYWEKLKHQYAGMAMQGMLSNPSITERDGATRKGIIEDAERLATALLEKLKEEKV